MADTKISALTALLGSALAADDALPVVDTSASATKKITMQEFLTGTLGSTGINGATVTTNAPLLNQTQTWNAGGVTFTGWKLNITDTASAAASLLMDLQIAGTTKFKVNRDGQLYANFLSILSGGHLSMNAANDDTLLLRDAAGTLAQRNGVNAQASRLYNTFTDAANYERLAFNWAANVLTILNENAGTGVLRDLILRGILQSYDTTVAALPAAGAGNKGQRRHVTDATAPTFLATVVGGGAVVTPVFSNGTNWVCG